MLLARPDVIFARATLLVTNTQEGLFARHPSNELFLAPKCAGLWNNEELEWPDVAVVLWRWCVAGL